MKYVLDVLICFEKGVAKLVTFLQITNRVLHPILVISLTISKKKFQNNLKCNTHPNGISTFFPFIIHFLPDLFAPSTNLSYLCLEINTILLKILVNTYGTTKTLRLRCVEAQGQDRDDGWLEMKSEMDSIFQQQ